MVIKADEEEEILPVIGHRLSAGPARGGRDSTSANRSISEQGKVGRRPGGRDGGQRGQAGENGMRIAQVESERHVFPFVA
jgi:hypothetical protein